MIRAECQRLGTTPGHFVSCVLMTRYFSCSETEQTLLGLKPPRGRI